MFTHLSWLDLLGVTLEFWISIYKIFKLLTRGYEGHLETNWEIFFLEFRNECIFLKIDGTPLFSLRPLNI